MGIVEAMGHGVPCVAWGAAGPTSTIIDQETGFLVEPNNQQAFAKFIELLLKDENHAGRRPAGEHASHLPPADLRLILGRRQIGADLVARWRQVEHERFLITRSLPPDGVAGWPPLGAVPAPEHDEG